jgi:tRNA pseudouridine38-40 synthase
MGGYLTRPSPAIDAPPRPPIPSVISSPHKSVRIAICFAFLATHFQRYEFISSEVAVENLVMDTLIESRLVAPNAFHNFASLAWSAATRPDAGVHAAAQVLTLDIAPPPIAIDQLCDLLNRNMHSSARIRIWSVISVPQSFNAHRSAEIEEYCYFLPMNVLETSGEYIVTHLSEVVVPEFLRARELSTYGGGVLHSLHIGGAFSANDTTFLPIGATGAKFGKGCIRKIVGVMIGFAKRQVTIDEIRSSLRSDAWKIPPSPGMFLCLCSVKYPFYVRRYGRANVNAPDVEFNSCRPLLEQWKQEELFPEIVAEMNRRNPFSGLAPSDDESMI